MSHRPQLRPLGRPKPIHVRTAGGNVPDFVRLPGKTARKVITIRERWRIDDEWWRRPISRAYYAVVLDDGRALTLYHDLVEQAWYTQQEG